MTQPVRVGQVWKDRDIRSPNRVTVLAVDAERVTIQRPSRKVRVRLDRFASRFYLVSQSSPSDSITAPGEK